MQAQPPVNNRLVQVDPEVLARFRPPAGETLFFGLVRSIQILLFLGSCLAVVDFFTNWGSPDLVWLPFAIFALHLIGFYRGIWLEEAFRPNNFYTILAELIAITVVLGILETVLNLTGMIATTGINFVPNAIFIGAAWQMGRNWSRYFWYLHVQIDEAPETDGGIPGFRGRATLINDHRKAYDDMRSGCYWVAGIHVAVVMIAVALAKSGYITTNRNTENFTQNLIIWGAIHLFLLIPVLAGARLRYLRTNWRLNGLAEPAGFITRWAFYLITLVGLAFLPTLLLSQIDLSGLIKLPNGPDKADLPLPPPPRITPLPDQPFPSPPIAPGEQPPPMWDLSGLVAAIGFVLLAAVVGAIIFFTIFNLLKSGLFLPRWKKFNLKVGWGNFLAWLRSLFGPRRQREGFEREEGEAGSDFDLLRSFRRERLPNDSRGKVRFYYRQVSERARRAGKPRLTGQTPAEYSDYLAPNLEEEQLNPNLEKLTALYNEARYSPHPMDEAQAGEAQQSSEPLVAFFRHKTRRARHQPKDDSPPA